MTTGTLSEYWDDILLTPKESRIGDAFAACLLTFLSFFLFRYHVLGTRTFFGNPDRLNNNLKVMRHYVDGLIAGRLDAWSNVELLGYDSFSLPYTYPNPLAYLASWFGSENLYITAGYLSAALLAASGIAAYAFVRTIVRDRLAALTGAALYEFSAIAILKVSQNDMSIAVFILIPLLLLTIRRISSANLPSSFVYLSVLTFVMLQFTFLQKAAYAVLLTGAYALYLWRAEHNWRPIAVFASAMCVAMTAASPRFYSLVTAMQQYTRGNGMDGPQQFSPVELLRWFDGSILGMNFTDPTAVANGINLSEGFLLYTAAFTPFLVILGLLRYRSAWFGLWFDKRAAFFLIILAFTFSVIAFKAVLYLVYLLFAKVDFLHARILIIGLLPLVLVVALILTDLKPPGIAATSAHQVRCWLVAILVGILIVTAIELIARSYDANWRPFATRKIVLSVTSIIRVVASAIIFAAVLCIITMVRRSQAIPNIAYGALCVMLAGQAFAGADLQINGRHTRGSIPFEKGNFFYPERSRVLAPNSHVFEELHRRLEVDRYRSALLCDPNIAEGFCAAHVGQLWRLRLADGYYGLGVPKRIAALPWDEMTLGPRQVAITRDRPLPWKLLGLLNVKYALEVSDHLYGIATYHPREPMQPVLTPDTRVHDNPERVTPRAFFAKTVEPVADLREAVSRIFNGDRVLDVTQRSFAEGLPESGTFSPDGDISWVESGDRLILNLAPATEERFLVVNELYYPGWHALVGDVPTTIYPTNATMRGIVVPPNATRVTLVFIPATRGTIAAFSYAGALTLLLICIAIFMKLAGRADNSLGYRKSSAGA